MNPIVMAGIARYVIGGVVGIMVGFSAGLVLCLF